MRAVPANAVPVLYRYRICKFQRNFTNPPDTRFTSRITVLWAVQPYVSRKVFTSRALVVCGDGLALSQSARPTSKCTVPGRPGGFSVKPLDASQSVSQLRGWRLKRNAEMRNQRNQRGEYVSLLPASTYQLLWTCWKERGAQGQQSARHDTRDEHTVKRTANPTTKPTHRHTSSQPIRPTDAR